MHVLDGREKYNAQVASLGLRGLTTTPIRRLEPSGRCSHTTLWMDLVTQEWTEEVTPEKIAEDRSAKTMDWLVRYMANAWNLLDKSHPAAKADAEGSQPEKMARCFSCTAKPMRPLSIMRHHQSKHKLIFEYPRSCPERLRPRLEPPSSTADPSGATTWRRRTAKSIRPVSSRHSGITGEAGAGLFHL